MTDLGTAIMLAMADQRWTIEPRPGHTRVWSPVSRQDVRIPATWLCDDALEYELRTMLLTLVVVHGLRWEEDDPRGGNPVLN